MMAMLFNLVIVNKNFFLLLMPQLNVILLIQITDFSLQYHDLSLHIAPLCAASEIHVR